MTSAIFVLLLGMIMTVAAPIVMHGLNKQPLNYSIPSRLYILRDQYSVGMQHDLLVAIDQGLIAVQGRSLHRKRSLGLSLLAGVVISVRFLAASDLAGGGNSVDLRQVIILVILLFIVAGAAFLHVKARSKVKRFDLAQILSWQTQVASARPPLAQGTEAPASSPNPSKSPSPPASASTRSPNRDTALVALGGLIGAVILWASSRRG